MLGLGLGAGRGLAVGTTARVPSLVHARGGAPRWPGAPPTVVWRAASVPHALSLLAASGDVVALPSRLLPAALTAAEEAALLQHSSRLAPTVSLLRPHAALLLSIALHSRFVLLGASLQRTAPPFEAAPVELR